MFISPRSLKFMVASLGPVLALGLVGCLSPESPAPPKAQAQTAAVSGSAAELAKPTLSPATEAREMLEERDTLYSLLAYALVYKDWQTKEPKKGGRGHNIGCVLVDDQGRLVHEALNSNGKYQSGTQHGETRVMWQYQGKKKLYDLKGYTIYTTLEPCAMCSGMMVLQKVGRTVYGQTDIDYGKAVERLQLRSAKYGPYPRSEDLSSTPAKLPVRVRIDAAYKRWYDENKMSITDWLRSDEAKALYREAENELLNYTVRYAENRAVLKDCHKVLMCF